MRYALILPVLLLSGCANLPLTQTKLAEFTHADLANAATLANTNGYPARGAVWTAYDQLLTAKENQIDACKAAILSALQQKPTGTVGLATTTELAAELAASGGSPAIHANCTALPLPVLPPLPKP